MKTRLRPDLPLEIRQIRLRPDFEKANPVQPYYKDTNILVYPAVTLTFPNVVARRHIFGGAHPRGLWSPNSNSAKIFVQCTCPGVSSSYVYSFRSYHVDKHTNKQMPLKTHITLRYDTTLGNKHDWQSPIQCHSVSLADECIWSSDTSAVSVLSTAEAARASRRRRPPLRSAAVRSQSRTTLSISASLAVWVSLFWRTASATMNNINLKCLTDTIQKSWW